MNDSQILIKFVPGRGRKRNNTYAEGFDAYFSESKHEPKDVWTAIKKKMGVGGGWTESAKVAAKKKCTYEPVFPTGHVAQFQGNCGETVKGLLMELFDVEEEDIKLSGVVQ